MGSQSLAGTVERFFTLGRYDVIGILVLLLWMLSPFGSQMTLRLLDLEDLQTISYPRIQYFNTTCYGGTDNDDCDSSFDGASDLVSDEAALTSLMGANILSSQAVAKSPVDTWNNIKIPQLDNISSLKRDPDNPWIDVDENFNFSWVSISGIMTDGLPASGSSTFSIETSYTWQSRVRIPSGCQQTTFNIT